ncbi:uncharacterized protein LOC126669066 isoform X2 [Mercurialis annua]|uniref:uncharacterized protein LOC126669066 isoform X2 n=1 Tax=Mercurialis annua TaxID=3986 RepID=UPI00215F4E03|nr:uncharacterized protein LOC126669066 isoform X2 [Mercurialis annua]
MVKFYIENPSLLDNEEKALEENCIMESPALSFEAFSTEQKMRLRYNVADLFVKILENNEFNYRWRITAICCLGLALKMRTSNAFTYRKFLANKMPKLVIVNENDVLKVEILILHALDYNLRSVTALCFRSYFESLVAEPNVKPNVKDIIIQSHGDIRLARYNPSVVAASAVLASYYKDPACLQALLQGRVHLDENAVRHCVERMFDMCNQKLIPFSERNVVAGETSAAEKLPESSSESSSDTEEDNSEPLRHRPGKEPMFKEETGTDISKIMEELMVKAREHKKRENEIDVRKVMEELVEEARQSKEKERIRSEKVMEELKWMMGVKEEELVLDPSQFPSGFESDDAQEKVKVGKMKSFLNKYMCCLKIDKEKQD